MTTKFRQLSFHVEIEPDSFNGLDAVSYVQCELIRSISKRRLITRLGLMGIEQSNAASCVVRQILDF